MITAEQRNTKKGRLRTQRGVVTSWMDIPEVSRIAFVKIAKEIMGITPCIRDVYIVGSYHWGNYDKDSDYDVALSGDYMERFPMTKYAFHDHAQEKLKLPADLQFVTNKWITDRNLLKIPV